MYPLSEMRSKPKIKPGGIKTIESGELQKFAKAFIKIGEVELESEKRKISQGENDKIRRNLW